VGLGERGQNVQRLLGMMTMWKALNHDLVELPLDRGAADIEGSKLVEDGGRDVDGVLSTAHALVDNGGSGGLAVESDADGLATGVGAVVLEVRQSDNSVRLAVGTAARTEAGSVVGHVARAGNSEADGRGHGEGNGGEGNHFDGCV
jgi:hypothetical protein